MIVKPIVERHAEEAAFLWMVRDEAINGSRLTLAELARIDEQVDAHLDGLRLAGPAGWEVCEAPLARADAGAIFAAATLALESADWDRVERVVDVATQSLDLTRGLVAALAWLPDEAVREPTTRLLASESPVMRRLGIAACAAHGREANGVLREALQDRDHLLLRSRALRAVGQLGVTAVLPLVRECFDDKDEECRFRAAFTAGLLGEPGAVAPLGAVAAGGGRFAELACQLGLRLLPPPASRAAFEELCGVRGLERIAVVAAGITGDASLGDWLLERMHAPELARVAAEAFRVITGAEVTSPDRPEPSPWLDVSNPGRRRMDDDDVDRHLPWPDVAALEAWWQTYGREFQSDERYLLGNPVHPHWLGVVLRESPQRYRALAALELALMQREHPMFDVRAPAWRQQATLQR